MPDARKHSRLGIASFLIAPLVWIYFALAAVIFLNTDFGKFFDRFFSSGRGGMVDGMADLGTALLLLAMIFIVIPTAGHLIGLLLGAIGVFARSRKPHFAVAGIMLNILPFVVSLVLFVIGTIASRQ